MAGRSRMVYIFSFTSVSKHRVKGIVCNAFQATCTPPSPLPTHKHTDTDTQSATWLFTREYYTEWEKCIVQLRRLGIQAAMDGLSQTSPGNHLSFTKEPLFKLHFRVPGLNNYVWNRQQPFLVSWYWEVTSGKLSCRRNS